MRKIWFAVGVIGLSVILGATVLREPVAWAAQTVDANVIGPLDGNGNVKVHEQGTANVAVAGSVATRAVIPPTQFSFRTDTAGANTPRNLLSDAPKTSFAISSATFINDGDVPANFLVFSQSASLSECAVLNPSTFHGGPSATVPAHDTVHVDFPQPFVVPTTGDAPACLDALGPSTGQLIMVGFRF
jgi:hypothetical protein